METVKFYGEILTGTYQLINLGSWTCGDELVLKNIFASWDNTDDGNADCPTGNYAQCNGETPSVTVAGPLVVDFDIVENCKSVTVTTDITGGKIYETGTITPILAPYIITIDYGDSTTTTITPDLYNNGTDEFDDLTFPQHTYLIPGPHTITLTVKDTAIPFDEAVATHSTSPLDFTGPTITAPTAYTFNGCDETDLIDTSDELSYHFGLDATSAKGFDKAKFSLLKGGGGTLI